MTNTTPNSLFAFLNFNLNFFYLSCKRTNGNCRLVLLFTEIVYFLECSFHFLFFIFSYSVYSKFLALYIFCSIPCISSFGKCFFWQQTLPEISNETKKIKFRTTKLDDEKVLRELIFRVPKVRWGWSLENFSSRFLVCLCLKVKTYKLIETSNDFMSIAARAEFLRIKIKIFRFLSASNWGDKKLPYFQPPQLSHRLVIIHMPYVSQLTQFSTCVFLFSTKWNQEKEIKSHDKVRNNFILLRLTI